MGAGALALLSALRREAAAAAAAFTGLRARGLLWQPMGRLALGFVRTLCNRVPVSGRDEEIQVVGLLPRARAGLLRAPAPPAVTDRGDAAKATRRGQLLDAGARPF